MKFLKKHSAKLVIFLLLLITTVSVAVSVWALFFRKAPMLKPDHAATETEKNAEKIEDDTSEGGTGNPDGGKLNLVYSKEVNIDLSENTAEFLIGNLASSAHNMVVEIVIGDTVVAQSGAILPGYRVLILDLEETAARRLSEGIYNGIIRLHLYNEQTNEKEMISPEITVEISVSE